METDPRAAAWNNPVGAPLRVLLLEDSALDAELTVETLKDGGFHCEVMQVLGRGEFIAALGSHRPDVILADYSLPAFDGLSALRLARAGCPNVPFIFVSGALGEELAIDTLKEGATDYVLKHRLDRLVPSLKRALREAEDRRERERLELELRQRAEELAEADRRKDEFLAMLAHELRNPLAPILNALHLLGREGLNPEVNHRSRAIMERQIRHMARLLDDLLDVSRVSRGKILLRREVLDLVSLVPEIVEDHRVSVEAAGLTLEVAIGPTEALVFGDRTRLAQILGNLLSNATKFTPPGGRIRVELHQPGTERQVRLQVSDTGIGVEPAQLQRIFEPFAQERRAERESGGLGLGLALVRGLVRLHGGDVFATSAGPGQGSQFVCLLPLAETPSRAAIAEGGTRPQRTVPNRRTLVIDDNVDAADTLGELLECSGYEVRVAYTGTLGVELARDYRPGVIFCDLGLPDKDGFTVAREVRSDEQAHDVLLVAVSGYGQPQDRERSRAAGFDVHLTKPVDPAEIEHLLCAAE